MKIYKIENKENYLFNNEQYMKEFQTLLNIKQNYTNRKEK